MTQDQLVMLLGLALASPHGIVLATNDPQRAKQALYQARSKAHRPAFASLSFRTSPVSPDDELYIVKSAPPASDDLVEQLGLNIL